jgi:putative proteasome-type protease
MIADTRTNAGIDNISIYRKLRLFQKPGHHMLMIAAAGNLSATQSVVNLLIEGFENPESKEIERLDDMRSMFAAAQLVGRAVRRVRQIEGAAYEQASVSFDLSFLFGGQIAGGDMRLFQVYAAGNFIECSQDMPFMQIGEPKYGKPILDRAATHEVEIYDALKIGLISMDSTLKSNLGVGPPIDIALLRRDVLSPEVDWRIESADPYFHDLRDRWSAALRAAHMGIPRPPYENMRQ